jgi:hypothetical protein
MGFVAKATTKKRVLPTSGPLNDALTGSPWLTTGAIPVGALVRSAVFALDLTGARSSSVRGRQGALTSLLAPTASSHLWVETDDFKSWDFVLGMNNGRDEVAADWVVKLSISDATATVSTSRWLTRDDALVHGEHHDAVRNELLRALALGQSAEPAGEADVSAASLSCSQRFREPAPPAVGFSFSLMTALDGPASREQLEYSGYRVLGRTRDDIRWGLGMPKNAATDYVEISFHPGVLSATAQVASARGSDRRIAACALRQFIDRALFLIRIKDQDATYKGPEDWRPSA